MSNLVDRVFAEVCLDERITDGIFRMEEETHMDALRDYFLHKGIPREAAINVTNRMVEGKYPDRQAWRAEDGILVTWPSPQHKKAAMEKNPGKYTETQPPRMKPPAGGEEKEKTAPAGSKPEPGEKPAPEDDDKKEPEDDDDEEGSSGGGKKSPSIFQGDKELDVEPPRGEEQPATPPPPQAPTPPPVPRTPERIAAEKEVAKQIMATDDSTLSNVANPVYEATLKTQLHELYKKADELGFREAVTFLTKYVKP